jgi:hypothetical protein
LKNGWLARTVGICGDHQHAAQLMQQVAAHQRGGGNWRKQGRLLIWVIYTVYGVFVLVNIRLPSLVGLLGCSAPARPMLKQPAPVASATTDSLALGMGCPHYLDNNIHGCSKGRNSGPSVETRFSSGYFH